MLQYLPNSLTILRLLLTLPLGFLILKENYALALAVGFLAGLTDLLDGFFARWLQAHSSFGAALDPIADKTLITVTFVCLAQVELIPWYLAIAVITRDLIIVIGASCYYKFIGAFEFSATNLSKSNMLVQICFCVLVLLHQVLPAVPQESILIGSVAVLFIAAASGFDYVMSWTIKAIQSQKKSK
ncbi:MAG: CDP-alcohol phosphatidyltransferase family protein [Halioglobus sp.]|nr:CDP-alcohol phosphatidyltransferase family protein [Halioglobus sp.]